MLLSFSDSSSYGRNVMIFGVDLNSSAHVDNKKKDALIFDKVYHKFEMILHWLQKNNIPYILLSIILLILFYIWHKTFCLSLHYNVVNSYLFINGVAIYKFKAKDSEKKIHFHCF